MPIKAIDQKNPILASAAAANPCKTFYSGNALLKKSIVATEPNGSSNVTRATGTRKVPYAKTLGRLQQNSNSNLEHPSRVLRRHFIENPALAK